MGDRRRAVVVGEQRGHRLGPAQPARVDADGPVGQRRGPLEAVLGQQDRGAEVGVEPGHGGEHVVGALGVELAGGLVEHEDVRGRGQRAGDGGPLALAAGEGGGGAVAQVGDAEGVEHLLDPAAHGGGVHAEVLEREGDVVLDLVDDELGLGVLVDEADDVGQVAGAVVAGAATGDGDRARGSGRRWRGARGR